MPSDGRSTILRPWTSPGLRPLPPTPKRIRHRLRGAIHVYPHLHHHVHIHVHAYVCVHLQCKCACSWSCSCSCSCSCPFNVHLQILHLRFMFRFMFMFCLFHVHLQNIHLHLRVHGDHVCVLHNRGRCDTFRSRLDPFETRFKPQIDPFGTRKVTPGPHRSPRGTQEGAVSAPEGPNVENSRQLHRFDWFPSPLCHPSYVPLGQV